MPDLSGNLSSFGVLEVLELLAAAAKTGELRLHTDGTTGRILLHEGDISYATTATGANTVEELDRLLSRYQPGAEDIGAGPKTIELALEEKVTDVLDAVLDWKAGSFDFQARTAGDGAVVYRSSLERAMELVGARRDEWAAIREVIPANDAVHSLAPSLPDGTPEATFDGLRWRLLALVGEGGSVDLIARELAVSEFRAASLLFGLIEDGFVQRIDAGPRTPAPVPFERPTADHDHPSGDGDSPGQADDASRSEVSSGEPGRDRLPDLAPPAGPVSFTAADLSQEEKNELIRAMGRGVFPT